MNQHSPFDATMPRSNAAISLVSEEDLGGVTLQDALNSGIPTRQPVEPPETLHAQKFKGFVRFLKGHVSPNHNRVTAGGRIVPAGPKSPPPTFHREFIETLDSVLLSRGRTDEAGKDQSEPGTDWNHRIKREEQLDEVVHETEQKAMNRSELAVEDRAGLQSNQIVPDFAFVAGLTPKIPEGFKVLEYFDHGKTVLVENGDTVLRAQLTSTGETKYDIMQQVARQNVGSQARPYIPPQMFQSGQEMPIQNVIEQDGHFFDQPIGYLDTVYPPTMGQTVATMAVGNHHLGAHYLPIPDDTNSGIYHQTQHYPMMTQHGLLVSWPGPTTATENLRTQLHAITNQYASIKSQLNDLEKYHALHDTFIPAIELQKSLNHKKTMIVQLDDLRKQKDMLKHAIRGELRQPTKPHSMNISMEPSVIESRFNSGSHQGRVLHYAQPFNHPQQYMLPNVGYNVESFDGVFDGRRHPGPLNYQEHNVRQLSPSAPSFVPKSMLANTDKEAIETRNDKKLEDHMEVDPATKKRVQFVTVNSFSKYQGEPPEEVKETVTMEAACDTSKSQKEGTREHAEAIAESRAARLQNVMGRNVEELTKEDWENLYAQRDWDREKKAQAESTSDHVGPRTLTHAEFWCLYYKDEATEEDISAYFTFHRLEEAAKNEAAERAATQEAVRLAAQRATEWTAQNIAQHEDVRVHGEARSILHQE